MVSVEHEHRSAPDQTPDDLRSLVFDSEPLAEDVEILGNPLVKLDYPRASGGEGGSALERSDPDGKSWS